MQGINDEIYRQITEKYGFDIKSAVPFKDAYILNTSKARKVLRKCPFSPQRILFIHGAKEHLYANNFKNLDRCLCTLDGDPFITIDGTNYTITNVIDGRECNFDDTNDVIKAANLLASLHKASKGYIPPENSLIQDELGKLPIYFKKRLDEMRKLKKVARRGRNKFDYLFLEYVDYFCNIGENVMQQLSLPCYERVVNKTKQDRLFCHHDFTHQNIICNNEKAFVINFNYCCFELKVYDIANLLRRKMRKCNWDIKEARIMLDEYRKVEEISSDDFFIMKLILQFPQKFWRVANRYYNSKRSWSEKSYILKLQEVVDEVGHHEKFIDMYEKLF